MALQIVEHILVTSTTASVEFADIPQDGTDLVLYASIRSTNTSIADRYDPWIMQINSSETNYTHREIYYGGTIALGSSSLATRSGNANVSGTWARLGQYGASNSNTNTGAFALGKIMFTNYTNSAPKRFGSELGSEDSSIYGYEQMGAWLWNDTSAITNLKFALGLGSFTAQSTFTLYKTVAGSDGTTTVS